MPLSFLRPSIFSTSSSTSGERSAPARDLCRQLQAARGSLAPELASALIQEMARARDARAMVSLIEEGFVELSAAEMKCLADALETDDATQAARVRAMSVRCTRLYPSRQHWGDVMGAAWARQPSGLAMQLARPHAASQRLARQVAKTGGFDRLIYPGCRLPPAGLQGPLSEDAATIYRSLLSYPVLLAEMPFAHFHARTGQVAAALVGASLTRADAGWRRQLMDLLRQTPSADLVGALLPHGEMLSPLAGQGVGWIDLLVQLRATWQAGGTGVAPVLRGAAQTMEMEVALAWCALHAVTQAPDGGARVAAQLTRMPAGQRHACFEALLRSAALRQALHASGALECTWQARHGLASLGAAVQLPEGAQEVYAQYRQASDPARPEVALWLTCLHFAAADAGPSAQVPLFTVHRLMRLIEMGAGDLEEVETRHASLRQRLVARLRGASSASPLVNAFIDSTPSAVAVVKLGGPGLSRLQEASVQQLRTVLTEAAPARRAQQLFAGCSTAHAAALRRAICADAEGLLWPLYAASQASRHALKTGLPLIDAALAPLSEAQHVFEELACTGLPQQTVVHATHLALVSAGGVRAAWTAALECLSDDDMLLALAGLGTAKLASQPTALLASLSPSLQRSADLAPQLWRLVASDGRAGKITELAPHDVGRLVQLFFASPSLLRLALDRLGQQPSRALEGSVYDDSDDEEDDGPLESMGDVLEDALRRVDAFSATVPDVPSQLAKQRLTELPNEPPAGARWLPLPQPAVRRVAQLCQWLKALPTRCEVPRGVALQRRAAALPGRRRPDYDALALAPREEAGRPLHQASDFAQRARDVCHDLGQLHATGIVPLPRRPEEPKTFGAAGLDNLEHLVCLSEVQEAAHDGVALPARWSRCVQACLTDVVEEVAAWARATQATPAALRERVETCLAAYLAAFTEQPEDMSLRFVERALPWDFIMPTLATRPDDAVTLRALQLIADFALLLRLTRMG